MILSWNTKNITDRCLTSMKESIDFVKDNANVEVVVVDNASSDGSPEMISRNHQWVKLLSLKENLGYASGNNFGVKHTNFQNRFLILMNNDIYVKDKTIEEALDFMDKNPNCDVLGCYLEFPNGRFQPSAGYLPTPSSVWSWMWGLDKLPFIKNLFFPVHPKERIFFKKDRKVGWVMGAFLFMKREVFEKTKGFDEKFFMYMEEVEWCKRVEKAGYKIFYSPKFKITHVDKASALGDPERLIKIYKREIVGIVYYLRKHYPKDLGLLTFVIKVGVLFRFLAFSILGNKIRSRAYWQALKEL